MKDDQTQTLPDGAVVVNIEVNSRGVDYSAGSGNYQSLGGAGVFSGSSSTGGSSGGGEAGSGGAKQPPTPPLPCTPSTGTHICGASPNGPCAGCLNYNPINRSQNNVRPTTTYFSVGYTAQMGGAVTDGFDIAYSGGQVQIYTYTGNGIGSPDLSIGGVIGSQAGGLTDFAGDSVFTSLSVGVPGLRGVVGGISAAGDNAEINGGSGGLSLGWAPASGNVFFVHTTPVGQPILLQRFLVDLLF